MAARGSRRGRASGFTLVEMLITVAIAGVLAGMSAMALNRLKSRGNFASATGDFLATLLAVSLAYMAAVPLLRDRFQALVDRYVFGIKHTPEEVIGIVSERIPTAFDREVLHRIEQIPGVQTAGITDSLPMSRNRSWGISAKGKHYEPDELPGIFVYVVTPGYLNAIGMRLIKGRDSGGRRLLQLFQQLDREAGEIVDEV